MRILVVNAYSASSFRGCERYKQFRHHVMHVVGEVQKTEVTRIEVMERHRSNLDSFLFDLHSEFADPRNIANFDQLDFVFVDGDANSSPWAPSMRKLTLLTKMCMMTGKCFFGSGVGALLLAFICSIGGDRVRVMNNEVSSITNELQDISALPKRSRPVGFASPHSDDGEVVLDSKSGDFFVFLKHKRLWTPKGNTGLILHSSDRARRFGARPNSARAGSENMKLDHHLLLSKRGEVRCSIRLEVGNQHPIISATFPRTRKLVLNCKSKWDLDEKIVYTSGNQYRVLIDSSRGPMLLEFENCFGLHFELASEYPDSLALLRTFTLAKYDQVKIHAHIDRCYISSISESAHLKQRLTLAQSKCVGSCGCFRIDINLPGSHNTHLAKRHEGIKGGKSFPKRSRPVSAGSNVFTPISIQTLRASISDIRLDTPTPIENVTPLKSKTKEIGNNHKIKCNDPHPYSEIKQFFVDEQNQITSPRIVRILQKNEYEKPYCAQQRFAKLHKEKILISDYYSVVDDTPYISAYEREAVEKQRSKLRWIAGPFRTAIGKATTSTHIPEASIFTKDPFVQKNKPIHMTQRRNLDSSKQRMALKIG